MNILVFRTALLSYSETFIPAQAEQLQGFTPYYAGLIPVPGLTLPAARTLAMSPSPARGQMLDAAAVFGLYAPAFLRGVRRIAPELIHAHFEEGGLKAAGLAQRLRVPLITTCHGYDVTVDEYRWQPYPGLGAYYQKRRRDLFRQGSLFLGVSRFICDQMLRRGYPAAKVRQHYIGLDLAAFAPDPAIVRRPVILFTGRLVEKKGCADLIRAMARVTPRFPEATLEIIGDGPLRPGLEALARDLRVPATFRGAQPQDAVRRAMAEAALFCGPSVRSVSGDCEGLPIVLLEAMALATPVVATRHAGIPEAVNDGETGVLVPERSPEALADAIAGLLDDTNLRRAMGAAVQRRVATHFNLRTQTALLEQMYAEVLR